MYESIYGGFCVCVLQMVHVGDKRKWFECTPCPRLQVKSRPLKPIMEQHRHNEVIQEDKGHDPMLNEVIQEETDYNEEPSYSRHQSMVDNMRFSPKMKERLKNKTTYLKGNF